MKNAQKEQEPFVFEPEEEEHKSVNPTVLLVGISQKPGRNPALRRNRRILGSGDRERQLCNRECSGV